MAAVDWPTGPKWIPADIQIGLSAPGTSWSAPYGGALQRISLFNDKLMARLSLIPLVDKVLAGQREAWLFGVKSAGDVVRLHHFARPRPNGTLTGSPTVTSDVLAGARSISLSGCAVGATLIGGDMLGVGGKLLQVSYVGGAANGSGVMALTLSIATRAAITAGAAVTLIKPTSEWQIVGIDPQLEYRPGGLQLGPEVFLIEA